jgi:hypothetical protein
MGKIEKDVIVQRKEEKKRVGDAGSSSVLDVDVSNCTHS